MSVAFSKERSQIYEYISQKVEDLKEYMPSRAQEVPIKNGEAHVPEEGDEEGKSPDS